MTIDGIVDQAWTSLLARVMKKRGRLRTEMGDEVDLFLPQSRLLSLAGSSPALARLLYSSARQSARRNAYNIVRKLGMPPDYFWKFELWPKGRAFTTLEKIVSKVFSSMMSEAKEGNLKIVDLGLDPLRISISFADCVECAGMSGLEHAICYYHAGTFSGVISGLISRGLDSFETSCCACGDESCGFIIGDEADEYIRNGYDSYMSRPEIGTSLSSRLEDSIRNLPARALLGNMVDVNYLQLVMATTLLGDPQVVASTAFKVGAQLGRKLALALTGFSGHEGLQNVGNYYSRLGEFCLEIKEGEPHLELMIRECAECAGNIKVMEMMSFLFGELQGFTSELTRTEMILKESRFEDDKLVLVFVPKAPGVDTDFFLAHR